MESTDSRGVPTGDFCTTRWTAVSAACDPEAPEAREALEQLCQNYWLPLYAFAYRRLNDRPGAQDATQAFFAHFLERGYLRAADRSRGRFRTFLLTCFQHFLAHAAERLRAAKRGGQLRFESLEQGAAELEARIVAAPESRPEELYDREWALVVLHKALVDLRQEFAATGRMERFEHLQKYLQVEPGPGDYAALATLLGLSEAGAKVAVHRLRRRLGERVREEIRHTVLCEGDVEEELRYLVRLLGG